jgi:hypothetical protein
MKILVLLKTFALVLSVSAAVCLLPQQQDIAAASCTNAVTIAQNGIESYSVQCTLAPQTSWLSWFSGQSSSAQFHFIDLLELLSRFHAKQA